VTLPGDWPEQRETLRCIATHLLARARYAASGRFSLEPTVGGFGTPTFITSNGTFRRLRITSADGAYLVDEQITAAGAAAHYLPLFHTTIAEVADAIGVDLDAEFSAGNDSPELGDPHRTLYVDPSAVTVVADWYVLGSKAIDRSVNVLTARAPAVARVWPEHFDLGTDIEVAPGRRCNLGASLGDESHPEPYLYVGPWGEERPGDDGYWNAPFGAVRGYTDIVDTEAPLFTATVFFHDGIHRLGARADVSHDRTVN
jgi:hypothetical protein